MNLKSNESPENSSETKAIRDRFQLLADQIEARVFGQPGLIQNLLTGFACGGHVLLEGLPGLAKTTVVRLLAQGLGLPFGRVQMTPDVMPGDILGSSILKPDLSEFRFQPGPIFTTILLVDELNRAPAKVQSSLLEAMQESQVTLGGQTHALSPLFWVVATQNPIDQEGTYPLAESQKDRFLMRLTVGYPEPSVESAILSSLEEPLKTPISTVGLVPEQILALRNQISTIHCAPVLVDWAAKAIQATRQPSLVGLKDQVLWGVSPRGGRMWLKAARARAWWMGRDFVVPEDLKALAESALGHRIVSHWTNSQVVLESPLTERIMDRLGPP